RCPRVARPTTGSAEGPPRRREPAAVRSPRRSAAGALSPPRGPLRATRTRSTDPRRAPDSAVATRDEGLEDLPALQELERVVELRVGAELAFLDVQQDGFRWRLSGAGGGGRR